MLKFNHPFFIEDNWDYYKFLLFLSTKFESNKITVFQKNIWLYQLI